MFQASVKDSMSKKLVTILWDRPVAEALALLEKHRIRHLPVIDDQGVIMGILSDRDLSRARGPGIAESSSPVRDFMTWPVLTVDENLPLRHAADDMVKEKISAFLVTDAEKEIVGIVTTEDLLKVLVRLLDQPSGLEKTSYQPLLGELLREAQAAGI